MSAFTSILKKDFTLALRGKELLFSSITLAILLSVLFMCGVHSAFITPLVIRRIFPILFWCGLIFICLLTISRSFSGEYTFRAIERLLFAPKKAPFFYLAKVASTSFITTVAGVFFFLLLALFLNLTVINLIPLGIIPLFVVGFSALAVIFAAMTLQASMQDVLLSLILIPLCFPLFFAALELTYLCEDGITPLLDTPWITLLGLLDIVYLWVGSILFIHTIKD